MALTDNLTAIGDAIREKTGTTEPIPLVNMPAMIRDISGGSTLNIAYGDTPPEDTSKLWIRANAPDKLTIKKEIVGAESVSLLDAHLPALCKLMGCAKVGNKIYLFGGKSGSNVRSSIYVFDTETETITTLSTTLPIATSSMGCASIGKKIYLLGGFRNNSGMAINVFDTETETITTLSTTLPPDCYNMACAGIGSKIYLLGGKSNNGQGITVFDTVTETVTTLATKLPEARSELSCAVVGTKIYVCGGVYLNSPKNTIYVFDTETETIATLATTLPLGCYGNACASIGSKIYLLGGYGDSVGYLDTIVLFDTVAETVTTLETKLPFPYCYMGYASSGNTIYLFGGQDEDSDISTIIKFTITSELEQGNIELQTSFLNNVFKLINTDNAQVEIGVENVYVGNENNEAELVEAYLHDGTDWVQI